MKFFTYDHHGEGMEYHDTEQEAKNHAQEILDSYTQNVARVKNIHSSRFAEHQKTA